MDLRIGSRAGRRRSHARRISREVPEKDGDSNTYTLGSIASHNIVIACLPSGGIGNNNAATAAAHMSRTFPSIATKRLLVGIGGGIPDLTDVRLGDVVVGNKVVQHDLGKAMPTHFCRTASHTKPSPPILTAVSSLQGSTTREPSKIPTNIAEIPVRYPEMSRFKHPRAADLLFQHSYHHTLPAKTCLDCDHSQLVKRADRKDSDPRIHHGIIASGNMVVKDGMMRNRLAHELQAICFDMEAAGIGEQFPCLVIRGICDYADSHKNKEWQEYAAAVAAAYAKELLLSMPPGSEDPTGIYMTPETRLDWLLESLAFEEMQSRHTSIKEAIGKTCEWFLHDPPYLDWLDPDRFSDHLGFLWISGKPGAGKSTIMKFTYAHTAAKCAERTDTIVLKFFFHARGASLEKSTEGMYRSLLHQILHSFHGLKELLDPYAPKLIPLAAGNPITWPTATLTALFQTVVQNLAERRIICFVDALDECDEDQIRAMISVFEDLGEIACRNRTGFYICFSSRHYPHITLQRGCLRVTLEDQIGHSQDIEAYVQCKLRAGNGTVATEMKGLILQKASGVFIWVVLAIEILNKELQRGRIDAAKQRLESLPAKLSSLFKDILTRETTNLEDLLLCIQWVLFAERPLTCKELYFAIHAGLTNDPNFPNQWDKDYETQEMMYLFILSASKGLVEFTKDRQVAQFIHESVREFLIKENAIWELWPELSTGFEMMSHYRLMTCCLVYSGVRLSSTWKYQSLLYGHDWDDRKQRKAPHEKEGEPSAQRRFLLEKYPFIEYATRNLLHHAEASRPYTRQQTLTNVLDFQRWISLYGLVDTSSRPIYASDASEHWAFASCGHIELLKDFFHNSPSLAWLDDSGESTRRSHPIFAAILNGRVAAYLFLFEHSVTNINMRNTQGDTMLIVAISASRNDIIQHLISRPDIDINARGGDGTTALMKAAASCDFAVVKQLMSFHTTDVNIQDNKERTALLVAVHSGTDSIFNYILRMGVGIKINVRDYRGRTALSCAAETGARGKIVALLRRKDLDKNLPDLEGRTPLLHALCKYRSAAAFLLLNSGGVDINLCDSEGISPLITAVSGRFDETGCNVTKKLLELPGLDINPVTEGGKTALATARLRNMGN
jgi:nucleoside phosphorylase/ankyrin repeat protein